MNVFDLLKSEEFEEAYYGKDANPHLKNIELNIRKFSEELQMDSSGASGYKKGYVEEVEESMCELLNVEYVTLYVLPDYAPNAFTITMNMDLTSSIDPKSYKLKETKFGPQFVNPKGKGVMVFLTTGLFRELTPDEIVAVILHEVGHNLFNNDEVVGARTVTKILLMTIYLPAMLSMAISNPLAFGRIVGVGPALPKGKSLFSIFGVKTFLQIQAGYSNLVRSVISLLSVFTAPIKAILWTPLVIESGVLRLPGILFNKKYQDEQFADAYATSMGYGVSLVSGLKKLHSSKSNTGEEILSKIPVLKQLNEITKTYNRLVNGLLNEHPSNLQRLVNQYNSLKKEVASDNHLSMRTKKELIKNLNEMDEYVKEAYTNTTKPNILTSIEKAKINGKNVDFSKIKGTSLLDAFMGDNHERELERLYNETK